MKTMGLGFKMGDKVSKINENNELEQMKFSFFEEFYNNYNNFTFKKNIIIEPIYISNNQLLN